MTFGTTLLYRLGGGISPLLFIFELDGGECLASRFSHLSSGKESRISTDWENSVANLEVLEKDVRNSRWNSKSEYCIA